MRYDGVNCPRAELGGADDAVHAVDEAGSAEVNRDESRVRVFAAHEGDVQLARKLQVFDEVGLPAQEPRVLQSSHRSANQGHCTRV